MSLAQRLRLVVAVIFLLAVGGTVSAQTRGAPATAGLRDSGQLPWVVVETDLDDFDYERVVTDYPTKADADKAAKEFNVSPQGSYHYVPRMRRQDAKPPADPGPEPRMKEQPLAKPPPSPKVAPAPKAAPAIPDLLGTTWVGSETLAGFGRLEFRFLDNNRVEMVDAQNTVAGRWYQNGKDVRLIFYDGSCRYSGIINGNQLSGTAEAGKNKTKFTWSVSR